MKRILIAIFIFSLVGNLIIAEESFAQGFNSITTSDGVNVIAVGDAGKFYRSADGGINWVSYPTYNNNLNEVTSFNNDAWIAADSGKVFKTQTNSSLVSSYYVGSPNNLTSIDFIDANTGFVCGNSGKVFKTVNGGINWTLSNSGISSVDLKAIDFKDINTGRVVGFNGNIYLTINGGLNWTQELSGTLRNLTDVKFFDSYCVVTGEYGVLLYNNTGLWSSINSRTRSDINSVTGTDTNDIHVCGGGGFIRNNRSGSSNYFNFEVNPMMANLVDIFYFDSNNGWAVSSLNNVIIRTIDGGISWDMPFGATVNRNWIQKTPSGSGIGNNLCMHPTDRNSTFVVYGNKVYVSRDKGDSWNQISTISVGSSPRAHSFYVSPIDTNIWMSAIATSPVDMIVRSTDYGQTWSTILAYDFSTYGQPLEMDQNDPTNFYFVPTNASGLGMFKSTDNGASFNLVAPYNNSTIGSPCDLVVMWDNSDVIFMGDDGADIFKTTNRGVNWYLVKPASSSLLPSMCNTVFDPSICYATTWGSSEVYKTFNHGENWSIVSNNSGSGWGSDICREDPTVVLTGNYGSQSFLSTNGGVNFFNVNTGLSGAGSGIFVPDRSYLLNMQTGSLFKMNISYSYKPIIEQIDVEALSVGDTGSVIFNESTIIPSGIVRNNNPFASATFNITRKISPGNYSSTKTISNLNSLSNLKIDFDPWTFNSGVFYTVRDSVYIMSDVNQSNNVKTGILRPYVGTYSVFLEQDFSDSQFPPIGWTRTGPGSQYWKRDSTVSGFGIGNGSSYYNFYNANTNIPYQYLVSPEFSPLEFQSKLKYDYAYAPFTSGTDSITIETSTNNGSSFLTLVQLFGNASATGEFAMNTAPVSESEFKPDSSQWLTKEWSLPEGTNKIRFRAKSGYANNFYLDNIQIQTLLSFTQLNIISCPQGLFNGSTLNISDTIIVFLRNINSPYNIVDSTLAEIDSNTLTAACIFPMLVSGTYYIQISHRNSLESWSQSGGHSFLNGTSSTYDFTTSRSKTYGNNSVLVGTKYCFYSGDVNQDGTIDLGDGSLVDNDAFNFASGYLPTDINGDGIVDVADAVFVDNNGFNFVSKVTP